jgi:proteic killer suppression protein
MRLDYADPTHELIETARAAETKLPVAVIETARQRLAIIRAAPDLKTLRNWQSLRLQPIEGGEPMYFEVLIAPPWRMLLKITENESVMSVVVTAIQEQFEGVV